MFRSGKDPLLLSGVSVEMLIMQTGCLAVQNAVTAWEAQPGSIHAVVALL